MTGTLAVVQARMGSTRLPGKVLAPLGGRPSLELLLARLARAETVDRIVVATSDTPADDPVASAVRALGFDVVRGSEHDVLGRFLTALEAHPAEVVVRITADCPLTDPTVVDAVVSLRARERADFASNTLVRTYPDGLDVEVLTAAVLHTTAAEATAGGEREHVTPFVIRRPERFRIVQHVQAELLGAERWTVDTPEDLAFVQDVVARLDDPVAAGWRDVLAVVGRRAEPAPVDVVPDIAAPDAARRRWLVLADGVPTGTAWVHVACGSGTAGLEVPASWGSDRRAAAVAAVERALRADLQVVDLTWS